ncbi:hypothetical protein HQQ80_01170 [Microbacteriaceae bacterium VKM Ac-2855]|nr:hypothetical protein [Microbacteriaceae bacterium VKM Ac-2855]
MEKSSRMSMTDTSQPPLTTDAEIVARAELLFGPAERRSICPLFLDHAGVQLPYLIPVDQIPQEPPADDIDRIVALFAKISAEWHIGGIVFVFERPGVAILTTGDRLLIDTLAAASRRRALPHRATVLVHDDGARLV